MEWITGALSALPFMTDARANLVASSFLPMLKAGLMYSIPLAIVSFIFGLMIALAVALVRTTPQATPIHRLLYGVCRVYVSAIRGTPILVQLFIIFFGLPSIGIKLDPIPSAIIAFSLNVGAYASETVRAAILSVPKGQWEAGTSVGMTYMQTFRHVILPQAFRVSIPPLSNTFISLVKETSLASLVLVTELFKVAQIIAARTYEFMVIYVEAAIIYWGICLVLFLLQDRIERHFERHIAK